MDHGVRSNAAVFVDADHRPLFRGLSDKLLAYQDI